MKTSYEKKAIIKLPKDSNAFAIDTPSHLPKYTEYASQMANEEVVKA